MWRLIAGLRRPRRQILGSVLAGQVAAAGPAVTEFAVGNPVFGLNPWALGAHAEFVCVRASGLIAHKQAGTSFDGGGGGMRRGAERLSALRRAGLRTGHKILIYGASGSIGTAAVQLARHMEADVTAVCDTRNLATVTSLGADRVIDYTAEDFTRNGQAYDVIYNAVGKHSFQRCRGSLNPGGIYLATDGLPNLARSMLTSRTRSRRVVFPMQPSTPRRTSCSSGSSSRRASTTPVIDRELPAGACCRGRPGTSRRSRRPGTSC